MWLPTKGEQKPTITPASHRHYICLKRMRYHLKKFVIFLTLSMLVITALSFLYFYIEHCYDPQKVDDEDKWKLCRQILSQQQQQRQQQNNTNTNITHLIDICEGVQPPTQIKCELTETNFFKYFDLTSTMAYTVGKYIEIHNYERTKIVKT